MSIREESLKKHYEWKGKIEVVSRVKVNTREDLSLAYTPGVAEPCMVIHNDPDKSYELTRRSNLVAVITDGTAVLGLGDLCPHRIYRAEYILQPPRVFQYQSLYSLPSL